MARVFVRFAQEQMAESAHVLLAAETTRYQPFLPMGSTGATHGVMIADLTEQERRAAERNGATVYEDIRFEPVAAVQPFNPFEFRGAGWKYWEPPPRSAGVFGPGGPPAPWLTKTQRDVMAHNRAAEAWATARGAGVTVGIVDTGVSAAVADFPLAKRSPLSTTFAFADGPWADAVGHGSMCAGIAAGTTAAGGRYDGVAPDALILSLRSNLYSTDIYKLYDHVLTHYRTGRFPGPVVLSNSYGMYTCEPPGGMPRDHPYLEIVRDAVAAGIVVVFAAGNNHAAGVCNHDPNACSPNTIWGVNSADEVLTVGTVNWDNAMNLGEHGNSSRGPGEWHAARTKPDCVAPTYGEVVWGSGYRHMEWWGTSGACPQVAGLAALLLSANPALTPAQVGDIIRGSCTDIGLGPTCAGKGVINCVAALANAVPPAPKSKPKATSAKKKKVIKK